MDVRNYSKNIFKQSNIPNLNNKLKMSETYSFPQDQYDMLTDLIAFLEKGKPLNQLIANQRLFVSSLTAQTSSELLQMSLLREYKSQLLMYQQGTQTKGGIIPRHKKPINVVLREMMQQIQGDLKGNTVMQQQKDPNRLENAQCNLKSHIREYLGPREDLTFKIDSLKSKLNRLLAKTKTNLMRDEPYSWEKIMASIEKQIKLTGQKQTLLQIKKQISQCLKKQQSRQQGATSKSIGNITALLSQNVTLLKQIKERKVLNNDKIYEFCQQKEVTEQSHKQPAINVQLTNLKRIITEFKNPRQKSIQKEECPSSSIDRAINLLTLIDSKTSEVRASIQPLVNPSLYKICTGKTIQSDSSLSNIKKRMQQLKVQLTQ